MEYWQQKVAVVTGATSGFGLQVARVLGQRGARLVLAARGAAALEQLAGEMRQQGMVALPCPADLTNPTDVQKLVDAAVREFGRIDLLLNSAGRSARGNVLETSPETLRELWELNFLGAFHCARFAAAPLIASRGHLVNIGSLASKIASPYLGAYPSSKFPLAALSQQLRWELGPQGVHVLLVCPGPIRRDDAGTRYDTETAGLPESARKPGGGVRLKGIDPRWLAERTLTACRRRQAELIVPGRARLLMAIASLSPSWGDWIVRKMVK